MYKWACLPSTFLATLLFKQANANDSVIRETFKYFCIHFSNSVQHISLICKNKINNNYVIHLVNK